MTFINSQASSTSAGNNTTTPLASAATFTGTAELNTSPDVLVSCVTDQTGTLYAEFSPDGTNWDSSLPFTVSAGVLEIHRLVKGYRYFRVRFTNTSASSQTYLRLNVTYGIYGPLTTPGTLGLAADADTLAVRPTDFSLDQALGRFAGQQTVGKFGQNAAVGTTEEDLWAAGGTYTGFLTSAAAVQIKAGGNAADTAAGAGARAIRVEGLDSSFNAVTEDITTNGASASAATTQTFIRVNRAYVLTTGTYHGTNAGTIDIETTGSVLVASITAGLGQTQLAAYTVPAGYTAYITRAWAVLDGSKVATIRLWRTHDADDVSSPYTAKRIIRNWPGVSGSYVAEFRSLIELPAKTDVWMSGAASAGSIGIAAGFDMVLVAT